MSMNDRPKQKWLSNQRGTIALLSSIVLLFAITIISLMIGRVVVKEQNITGNEQRAIKAIDAANAGLEYAMTWLGRNFVDADSSVLVDGVTATWTTLATAVTLPNGTSATTGIELSVPSNVTPGANDSYLVNVSIVPDGTTTTSTTGVASPYLYLVSTATDVNDSSVTSTVSQYMVKATAKAAGEYGGPPMVVDGCIDKAVGTPDLYPLAPGNTVLYTDPVANDDAECPDFPGGCDCDRSSHFDFHGGATEDSLSGTVWERLFPEIQVSDLIALSNYEAALVSAGLMDSSERTFYWVTDSTPWHTSLGSGSHTAPYDPQPEHMVVLGFSAAAGCPQVNGNPTIWGIVYIQGGCPGNGQGWGGATVYGTVGVDGLLNKFNANAVIYEVDWSGLGGPSGENPITTSLVRLPGTWRDF